MILDRPIVFFDLETTGVDTTKDRIVEIAIIKVYPNRKSVELSTRINPEIPIPQGASDVHGITDEDVKDAPLFKDVAVKIMNYISHCDIAGFNSNAFDVPLLKNEFNRVGVSWDLAQHRYVDVGVMFKRLEPRTLVAAAMHYMGHDLTDAHEALADTKATRDVFFKMIEKYDDLPKTVEEMDLYCTYDQPRVDFENKFTSDAEGYIVLNFGKDRGTRTKDAHGFISWMMRSGFSDEVKDICTKILAGAETVEQLKN